MKIIKLTDDHYVVVDDSQIKDGDWMIRDGDQPTLVTPNFWWDFGVPYKKITHSTQPLEHGTEPFADGVQYVKIYYKIKPISLQEVKELIGEVDVEKKAEKFIGCEYEDIEDNIDQIGYDSFIRGYNQALEDNKDKKYTEKQLIWAIQEAYGHGQDDEFDGVNKIEESIKAITKHLQPKTEWEYIGECKGNNGNGCFMDSPGHDCGCYKRVPKTQWEVELIDGKLKLI